MSPSWGRLRLRREQGPQHPNLLEREELAPIPSTRSRMLVTGTIKACWVPLTLIVGARKPR